MKKFYQISNRSNRIANIILIGIVIIQIISDMYLIRQGLIISNVVLTVIKYMALLYIMILNITAKNRSKYVIERYKKEIYTDDLTKCHNRRYYNYYIKSSVSDLKKGKNRIGLIMIDIDDFKIINDTFGHLCGDEVLIYTCKIIKNILRESDVICRIGGDEFIIILNEINNKKYLIDVCDRIKEIFTNFEYQNNDNKLIINLSMGYYYIDKYYDSNDIFMALDNELYKDKHNKRKDIY